MCCITKEPFPGCTCQTPHSAFMAPRRRLQLHQLITTWTEIHPLRIVQKHPLDDTWTDPGMQRYSKGTVGCMTLTYLNKKDIFPVMINFYKHWKDNAEQKIQWRYICTRMTVGRKRCKCFIIQYSIPDFYFWTEFMSTLAISQQLQSGQSSANKPNFNFGSNTLDLNKLCCEGHLSSLDAAVLLAWLSTLTPPLF